jgi:hypothetical protein
MPTNNTKRMDPDKEPEDVLHPLAPASSPQSDEDNSSSCLKSKAPKRMDPNRSPSDDNTPTGVSSDDTCSISYRVAHAARK